MGLAEKGPPGSVAPPLAPWFTFGDRRTRGARVICGHWSALGYSDENGVVAIDTGCVWAGALTALPPDQPHAAARGRRGRGMGRGGPGGGGPAARIRAWTRPEREPAPRETRPPA